MPKILTETLIHPDDQIYNALLDGGKDFILCGKYTVLVAIHDHYKPEEKIDESNIEFLEHINGIVESAMNANPDRVLKTLKSWLIEIEKAGYKTR